MAAGRLSGLDTAFLWLDHDVSPMHLGALAIFRPARPGNPARVVALLVDRAQRLSQLRRRVQPAWFPLAAPTWADDPGFRAGDHIHLHRLDGHGGLDEAAALAAGLMARLLPRTRPLWEFHVISGVGEGRFALLVKMHHALGDGLNALGIGFQVLDGLRPLDGEPTSPGRQLRRIRAAMEQSKAAGPVGAPARYRYSLTGYPPRCIGWRLQWPARALRCCSTSW